MSPAAPERRLSAAEPESSGRYHEPELVSPNEEAGPRRLRLVERQRRTPVHLRRLGVALLMASVAVLCLGLVALHALIAENQFALNQLQGQAAAAQAAYQKLRLQVAELEAPARIISVAEGQLKMVQPGSVTYLPAPKAPSTSTSSAGAYQQSAPLSAPKDAQSPTTVPAPQGDANWPSIKPYMSIDP
ncbi:MAG: hypothetical protein ACP5VR_06210 [Acidimicrobiales bacterium]